MQRTAKNKDSDLGCLLQSAIIAVLLIALTAFSLNRLEDLIQTEGTATAVEHADAESGGDETTADAQTAAGDSEQTDEAVTADEQPTVVGNEQADPTATADAQTAAGDSEQTDEVVTADAQPAVVGNEQADPTATADAQTAAGDSDQTDEAVTTDDRTNQGTGVVETADSVVDTTDEEAKAPEDGVVTSTDTTGDETEATEADYDPEVVAEGESLYILCAACHGPDARGLPGLGLDLLTSEFVESLSDEELRDFVIIGRPVWDLNNTTGIDMPPKGGNPILTGDDILKIISYIRTLRTQAASGEEAATDNSAPEITEEDIIALGYDPDEVAKGESLYILCSACHGPDARGLPGLGLDLLTSEFVESLSDEELLDFVVVGRPIWDPSSTTGVDMPPKGGNPILTDEDILKIIAYVRVLDAQGSDIDSSPPSPETSSNPAPAAGTEIDLSAAGYDPEIVSEGESLFVLCAACHGPDARGLPGLGLDLVASQFTEENDDEALLDFVLVGRPVWDPANTSGVDMPPKGGNPALTDEDTLKIIAYLRTLRANSTP